MSPLQIVVCLLVLSRTEGWLFPKKQENETKVCLAKSQSDDKLEVEFALYTRDNPDIPEDLTTDQNVIRNSGFSSSKNTKFITHGYTDKGAAKWIYAMLQAILEADDVNVIVVNWQKGADSLNYAQSAANTLRVGEIVGDFIKALHESTDIAYASVHLIGHSLGAHISGFAGARLDGMVGRVTGLDPAGPCFRFAKVRVRLNENQAQFVDVIHTDSDSLLQGGFGAELPMGHADYYPNGGRNQPGCKNTIWKVLVEGFKNWFSGPLHPVGFRSPTGLASSAACSHNRVTALFTESVTDESKFTAYPCDKASNYETCMDCGTRGCSKMGYYAPSDSKGIYTLRTGDEPPYSY